MESEVREIFFEQLLDAYSAERQSLRCMQNWLRRTGNADLRACLESHIEETDDQIKRVLDITEFLEIAPTSRPTCESMRLLIEEASFELNAWDEGPNTDALIASWLLRIESAEFAAYSVIIAFGRALGEVKVVEWLQSIARQEQQTVDRLSDLLPMILSESIDDEE